MIELILTVELVLDNLKQLLNLISDAKHKWFELGLQLDIKHAELKTLGKDNIGDTNACYTEMLAIWLKSINPRPSWDDLLTALENDSVQCGNLAEAIRKKYGIMMVHSG